MTYKVEILKQCGCFVREGLAGSYEFDDLQKAMQRAKELADFMNKNFCGKHQFKIEQNNEIINIVEDER